MYAIFESGGHQYRVAKGDTIDVNLMDVGDSDTVQLGNVLMIAGDGEPKFGAPFVAGAVVHAKVLGEVKGEKLTVFKYKRKNRYRVKTGHRQRYVRLQIDSIQA
jgi:large subunit ribosomal protein L21